MSNLNNTALLPIASATCIPGETVTDETRSITGEFVGVSPGGILYVDWTESRRHVESLKAALVRHDASQAAEMVKVTKVSDSVMMIAETSHENGTEAGCETCAGAVFTKTTITARRDFFGRLVHDFLITADDWRNGVRGIEVSCTHADIDDRFAAAANERIAKSFDRWAKRCGRIAGD